MIPDTFSATVLTQGVMYKNQIHLKDKQELTIHKVQRKCTYNPLNTLMVS